MIPEIRDRGGGAKNGRWGDITFFHASRPSAPTPADEITPVRGFRTVLNPRKERQRWTA